MTQDHGPPTSRSIPGFTSAWHTVSFGTKCMSAGTVMMLAGMLLLPLMLLAKMQLQDKGGGFGNHRPEPDPLLIPILACMLVVFTGGMVLFTGLCACCIAPAASGARPLALTAMIFWILFLLLVTQAMLGIPWREQRFANDGDLVEMILFNAVGFWLAAGAMAFASATFSSCFLCSVAHHFDDVPFAQDIQRFLMYQVVVLVAFLILVVAFGMLRNTREWYWLGPFALAFLVIVLVACAWQLRLLSHTRRMIASAARHARADLQIYEDVIE